MFKDGADLNIQLSFLFSNEIGIQMLGLCHVSKNPVKYFNIFLIPFAAEFEGGI